MDQNHEPDGESPGLHSAPWKESRKNPKGALTGFAVRNRRATRRLGRKGTGACIATST